MEYIFVGLILWAFFGYYALVILVDFVLPLLLLIAEYLVTCLIVAIAAVFQFIFRTVAVAIGGTVRWIGTGFLFTWYLILELRAGHAGDDDEADADHDADAFDDGDLDEDEGFLGAQIDEARALFGLGAAYTREELSRAYKRAIRDAHPDRGGTNHDAVRLNVARDLLMTVNGWG